MNEQDGILLPWHPESEKPHLKWVICTDGEGHYWIGRYFYDVFDSGFCYSWQESRSDGKWYDCHESEIPLAWIEPEKFVPFVKKKKESIDRYQRLRDLINKWIAKDAET